MEQSVLCLCNVLMLMMEQSEPNVVEHLLEKKI